MEPPAWMAPATGAVAFGTCCAMVGLYVYGGTLPETHEARVRAEVDVPVERAWALATDFGGRAAWRPNVARVERLGDVKRPDQGPDAPDSQVWREHDQGDDRFDLIVLDATPPHLVLATARPEDVGMAAEWTWTVTGASGRSVIEVKETGKIRNQLVRGWWSLSAGPYAAIGPDLEAFVRALGEDRPRIERD
ncbi:MAG: SRPBCC family protein [Myxococcota bacterium]